jgi:excinuclease ABC subunit A
MGACPECDGLGEVEFFDPRAGRAVPGLSLAAGAIKGWDRRNQFYLQMLQSLAAHLRLRHRPAVRATSRDRAVR